MNPRTKCEKKYYPLRENSESLTLYIITGKGFLIKTLEMLT